MTDSIGALRDAVRRLHGVVPIWISSETVSETFEGAVVWTRTVELFDLGDDAPARQAFAWVEQTPQGKLRYFAVLRAGPIETARDAVRASILQDQRDAGKSGR